MIKSLRLANFRRHEELDLRFDESGQIILIAGRNGVGKTTILEAILYALYAEGRHGRKNLDMLVKRGAELEGMEVEISFTIGNDIYRVLRRRDGRASTALLFANDHPLIEGQREVTDEITRILGMDSAGFRLATIAQQKDLDGLASLTPAVRTKMVSRLLRLDSITRAKDAAAELHNSESKLYAQLRPIEDVSEVRLRQAVAEKAVREIETEITLACDAVTSINSKLSSFSQVEQLWTASQESIKLLTSEFDSSEKDIERIQNEISSIIVPLESDFIPENLLDLTASVAHLEREIAEGEMSASNAEHRRIISSEISAIDLSLQDLNNIDIANIRSIVEEAVLDSRKISSQIQLLEEEYETVRNNNASAEAAFNSVAERLSIVKSGAASCNSCGQTVSEDYRVRQIASLDSQIIELELDLASKSLLLKNTSENISKLRSELIAIQSRLSLSNEHLSESERLLSEETELLRRKATYIDQLERLQVTTTDLNSLYARKAELAHRVAATQHSAEIAKVRAEALVRSQQLKEQLDSAVGRRDLILVSLKLAEPSNDLIISYNELSQLRSSLSQEEELLAYWRTELAVSTERLASSNSVLIRAEAEELRRAYHQDLAYNAGNAKRLLTDVSERLSTIVRPSLEGSVSFLLQSISEGRFNRVKISEDYDITVEDDGAFRSLSELSGGEVDLVALSMRLALAQIVSDRHGSGGAGFLILDEPLGSQDPQRRSSILNGLRAIRDTYTQIFLISHIDGIDESADTVITVQSNDDRSETMVDVA